jgi:nifR3 family TIM-barrel protein
MRRLRIANVELASNLVLAPLAGFTDLAFRLVARQCGGVGLAYTDLLCPQGVLRENFRSMQLAATCQEDRPLAMQLYGSDAALLSDAARWAEDHGATFVDINMGCPVEKITSRAGGSALLCDPHEAARLAQRVAAALRRAPLTAKIRLGWDDQSIVAPQLARDLESAGVAMVAVHGRTAQMKFSGQVRLEGIAQVVAAVRSIPIIGNGDVRTPDDARRMLQQTGCAGVMIGRAAISSPWIFRDTLWYLATGTVAPPPSLGEKCDLMRQHFRNMVRFRREWAAVCEFRQRVSWYAKEMHPCRMLKDQMRSIRSAADFEAVVDRFLSWRGETGRPAGEHLNHVAHHPAHVL